MISVLLLGSVKENSVGENYMAHIQLQKTPIFAPFSPVPIQGELSARV
jgi:hypothetical protein